MGRGYNDSQVNPLKSSNPIGKGVWNDIRGNSRFILIHNRRNGSPLINIWNETAAEFHMDKQRP